MKLFIQRERQRERKYTSLQIQYTYKEAHLTPTDISEDWRTHISKYFISYVGNSQSEHIEMYARTSIPKVLLNECIYASNLCLFFFVRGKGENLCVRGEIRCYSHPFLAFSFEWQAVNSHWSWKGECKHMLTQLLSQTNWKTT